MKQKIVFNPLPVIVNLEVITRILVNNGYLVTKGKIRTNVLRVTVPGRKVTLEEIKALINPCDNCMVPWQGAVMITDF